MVTNTLKIQHKIFCTYKKKMFVPPSFLFSFFLWGGVLWGTLLCNPDLRKLWQSYKRELPCMDGIAYLWFYKLFPRRVVLRYIWETLPLFQTLYSASVGDKLIPRCQALSLVNRVLQISFWDHILSLSHSFCFLSVSPHPRCECLLCYFRTVGKVFLMWQ